jgi:hypothetical protein
MPEPVHALHRVREHWRSLRAVTCYTHAAAGSFSIRGSRERQPVEQRISNQPDDPVMRATSIGELPAVVQCHLVFQAIVTALGFPSDGIGHTVTPGRSIGGDGEGELAATLEVEGRGFSYVLGPAIPHMDSWLRHAAEVWRSADQAAREALYQVSPFFEGTRFPELLRALMLAGLTPPIPMGLAYSRLESAGIGDAVRRSTTFPAASPHASASKPASRTVPGHASPAISGPPRFTVGELAYMNEESAQVPRAELDPLLQRHASGDWGESLYGPDNEAALKAGRAVMSAFRTTAGESLWLITWASRTRTAVWLQTWPDFPEEALLDLVCRYVGTGRRTELRASPHDVLFHVPLVGKSGPADGTEAELAALLLGAMITQNGEKVIPYRPEQMVRALWRAVDGIDLRPIDRKGRRMGKSASDRAWTSAKQRCLDQQIFAWFAATWEDRPS